jgi:hypothetical protein
LTVWSAAREGRHPEVGLAGCAQASGPLPLSAFAAQEGEGEVDAFDLALPVLVNGSSLAGEEILFDLVEAGQHLGVDAEHRAADAGMFGPGEQRNSGWR